MPQGLRHCPVPALINSAEWALRPVVTARDLELARQALAGKYDLPARTPARHWYLLENKLARQVPALVSVSTRSVREPTARLGVFPCGNADLPAHLPALLDSLLFARTGSQDAADIQNRSLSRILHWQSVFGIPEDYARQHQLTPISEPLHLHFAGRDYVGRSVWLEFNTRQAWLRMHRAAEQAGIALHVVSAFRSIEYQADIWNRKLTRGQTTAEILRVNVPPGFSEHHSGRALDLSTEGVGPAEPEFANTPAFQWLMQHAHQFGFQLSFPEGNRHGVMYEPWHWCFRHEPHHV